jgi:DNA-binding transcriptional MerR regulator
MLKHSLTQGEKMLELTITAVAREVGVRPSTLRDYERIGLLPAARRVGGRRRYDDYALNQVELITYAKRAGFTLAQIRSLRENASLGNPPATLCTTSRPERPQNWIK